MNIYGYVFINIDELGLTSDYDLIASKIYIKNINNDKSVNKSIEENFSGEPIKVGRINQSTGTIILLYDFQLNVGSSTKYYISIWLDGNIADSQYVNQSFSGYIKASAIQQDQ